jgi:hypothetical protein
MRRSWAVAHSSQRAALRGPISVDYFRAWQTGCQSAVLESVGCVPESRGRRHQLAMYLMQDQLKIAPWDLILHRGVCSFILLFT